MRALVELLRYQYSGYPAAGPQRSDGACRSAGSSMLSCRTVPDFKDSVPDFKGLPFFRDS